MKFLHFKVWSFYIFTWQSWAIVSYKISDARMRKHMWKQFDKYKPQLIQMYSSGIPGIVPISRFSLLTWKCNPVMLRKPYFQQTAEKFLKFQNWMFLSKAQFLKLQKHGVYDLNFYSVFSKPFQRNPLKEELLRLVVWLWFIRLAASALPHPKTTESDFLGVVPRNVLTSSPDDFMLQFERHRPTLGWVFCCIHCGPYWFQILPLWTLSTIYIT